MKTSPRVNSAKKLREVIAHEVKGVLATQLLEQQAEFEAKEKTLHDSIAAQIAAATDKALAMKAPGGELPKGTRFAQVVRAYAAGGGDVEKAAAYAKESGMPDEIQKALATAPGTAGGYIVPPGYSADLIELLYNRVAVRTLGAVSVPMPSGNLTIPKLTAGITATYIGENQGQNAQQQTLGVVALSWKKLRASVPMSNDLVRFSNPRVDDMVRNDMVNAFAVAEDAAFLTGTGAGNAPKGLEGWITVAHTVTAASADGSDLTLVIADLFSLPKLLEESNIPFISPGWVISPRTKYFLMSVRDSVGNFYFLDEMRRGTLLGFPFVSTNQVSSTLGGASDESVIYFGDFNDALIGEADNLMLDVSSEASYLDSGGSLVSAFDLDQTVIRGIARHDFVVRRQESFAKLDGIKWGA